MGPRFFPRVISIILGFTSVGLIVNTLLRHRKEMRNGSQQRPDLQQQPDEQRQERPPAATKSLMRLFNRETLKGELRALAVLITMTAYAILMPVIGFIISSALTGAVVLVILGTRKWYHYVILFASVYLIYYIFRFHLYVQLP